MSTKRGRSTFRVGDRVRLVFGFRKVPGIILEDRGALGVGGRRLFRVEIPMDPFESETMELPEDELEPAGAEPTSIETSKIVDYLVNGGLISILRSGISSSRNQPRVWLCFDTIGNVTHTFVAERGLIGGEPIPFGAVHGDRIFTAKRP